MRAALIALTSALALSASTACFAAETTVPVPVQTVSDRTSDNEDQIICRSKIHEGELLPVVRCNTKRGWERSRRDTQKFISDFQTHALVMGMRR